MKSFIKVKYQVPGVHRWKDCPFPSMDYLRSYHRHMFFFEVEIGVTELDREIEFIMLKGVLQGFTENLLKEPVEMSCESIAEKVLKYLSVRYGSRHYKITVYEDNENGGGVESD